MYTSEILKRVRQIEIKTRGLSNNIFAGQYHSAFRGRGMAFSEVREYQFGDDVRDIDWNVTARFHRPYVKVFEEERELTVMLLIDVSGSLEFGTVKQMKKDMVTEIAATLAFSAIQNNDKIGVGMVVDLSSYKSDDISLGRDYYDITPNIENSSGCWVYGDYKAQIELVKK